MDFVIDLNGRLGEGNRSRARYADTADLERLGLAGVRDWFEREHGDPNAACEDPRRPCRPMTAICELRAYHESDHEHRSLYATYNDAEVLGLPRARQWFGEDLGHAVVDLTATDSGIPSLWLWTATVDGERVGSVEVAEWHVHSVDDPDDEYGDDPNRAPIRTQRDFPEASLRLPCEPEPD